MQGIKTVAQSSEDTRLVRIVEAQKALEHARTIQEVKDIKDKAHAIAVYLKQQRASTESINAAVELKLRAERKAGQILARLRGFNRA